MAIGGAGRIVADRVPATPTKTKAQIEADERARLANAATEANVDKAVATRIVPQTVGSIINNASSFTPGVPASLSPQTSAYGRSDGPRGVGGQNNSSTGGSTSGGSGPLTTTTTDPAPVAQTPVVSKPAPTPPTLNFPDPPQYTGIKSAPIDTIEFIDETFSDNLIIDLLFEDVGGQELLTIARNDTVNGQSVVYQPFKNLGILQETYNATTLLRLQETSDKFFSNFLINLRSKIPNVGNGENGKNYYLDLTDGSGIIEFINIRSDEQVEIQIASAGIIEETGI